jgi:hypothetical protein
MDAPKLPPGRIIFDPTTKLSSVLAAGANDVVKVGLVELVVFGLLRDEALGDFALAEGDPVSCWWYLDSISGGSSGSTGMVVTLGDVLIIG